MIGRPEFRVGDVIGRPGNPTKYVVADMPLRGVIYSLCELKDRGLKCTTSVSVDWVDSDYVLLERHGGDGT